jgi:enolase
MVASNATMVKGFGKRRRTQTLFLIPRSWDWTQGPGRFDRLLMELDRTDSRSNLGANALLGVSLTLTRASAETACCIEPWPMERKPVMPLPMMNIINDEKHAGMICPFKLMVIPAGFKTFRCPIRCCEEIYHALRARLGAKVSEAERLRVIPTWSKYRTCG